MIGFLFRLALVALVAVLLGWAIPILTAKDPARWIAQEKHELALAYPGAVDLSPLMTKAMAAAEAAGDIPFSEQIPDQYLLGAAMAMAVTTIRMDVSVRMAPLMLLALAIATLCGLFIRERTKHSRSPERYYSVTLGYLSKFVLGAGVLLGVLFALTPLPLAYWSPYAATATASLGAFGYAANLVDRL